GEMTKTIDEIRAGRFVKRPTEDPQSKPKHAWSVDLLGIELVPDVLERTPPYIDGIRQSSPASAAGLKPDDLVLFVNDKLIQSCKGLRTELEYIDRIDKVKLSVIRGEELIEVTLNANEKKEEPHAKGAEAQRRRQEDQNNKTTSP